MRQPAVMWGTEGIAGVVNFELGGAAARPRWVTDVTSTAHTGAPFDQRTSAFAIGRTLQHLERDLVELRRSLHNYPEIGFDLPVSTATIETMLADAGLAPVRLRGGSGLWVDIGEGDRVVGLRADLDALPLQETTGLSFASRLDGRAHACGHDMHSAAAAGAALALAKTDLPGKVRVIFQPAEETLGGAHAVLDEGVIDGLERVFTLHCEPQIAVGTVGSRIGALTAACDQVDVHLSGPGGHTARPQLTVDIVDALARIVTIVPGLATRKVDPRASLSVVFGAINAGKAPNAIPMEGSLRGTVRMLSREAWADAEAVITGLITDIVAITGGNVKIDYQRGVPPVINDPASYNLLRTAIIGCVGEDHFYTPEQSMGGEDFGWYADKAPIAMGRLGVWSGSGPMSDLHQGGFVADERAIGIGANVLANAALLTLHQER